MKICYVVYREDNVMVFDSQVLEYLYKMASRKEIEDINLVVFRHESNLFKKEEVEKKIRNFVPNTMTFASLPVLSMAQLDINSKRLYRHLKKYYGQNDEIAVICRGDFAAYIVAKAFSKFQNSRILYDNRGLAYEESMMAHGDQWVHRINRNKKRDALLYAKSHCDMYNFVTASMREYMISHYHYNPNLPYTIIPTLYHAEALNDDQFARLCDKESIGNNDFIVTYIGSTAAWQSTAQLIEILQSIYNKYSNSRFFILTKGNIPELEQIENELKSRITVKGVPHEDIKYYLAMSDVGIVIRDDNIVNRVAAPTKIAEYLTSGMRILYKGDIGILTDLKSLSLDGQIIEMDLENLWLDKIGADDALKKKSVDSRIVAYFDMTERQSETIEKIQECFRKNKKR